MRTFFLVGALWSAAALAQTAEVELFTDRGDLFVKAGAKQGVAVGQSITILGDKIANTDERRRVGSATVIEVWDTLSRLKLDEAAQADKSGKKFVGLKDGKVTGATAGAKKAGGEEKKPAAAEEKKPAGGGGTGLKGHATFGGVGPWKVLRLFNENDFPWSNCRLALLPGSPVYTMKALRAGDQESVALSNFKWQGPERDVTHTSVSVSCNEGITSFRFPD